MIYLSLQSAGLLQIAVALGSLWIPKILHWNTGLGSAPILIRQMFWVYGGYIFFTNIWLGFVSLFFYADLVDGNKTGLLVLIYALLYWTARVLIQFFYFDKKELPKSIFLKVSGYVLDACFLLLAFVYGYALYQTVF